MSAHAPSQGRYVVAQRHHLQRRCFFDSSRLPTAFTQYASSLPQPVRNTPFCYPGFILILMTLFAECLQWCLPAARRAGMAHMDIKPENIMFDSDGSKGVLKVIDFGSSTYIQPDEKVRPGKGWGQQGIGKRDMEVLLAPAYTSSR